MKTNDSLARVRALSALVAATLLAACGGGSDAPPPPAAGPPPAPTTATVSGKAVDGALQGATACYDLNDNNACDSGEPASAAASDANGAFSIEVALSEVGKHRLIVNVPATAIDKDTGAAVGTAFTLVAPATGTTTAQSVFVSPLTTLVQQQIDSTGQTLAQARDFVQAQAGLAVSPLADFTAATNADNKKAALVGRLVLFTAIQQSAALAAAVNQPDLSGGTVSQADVNKATMAAVFGALPMIAAAASDPAVTAATGAALQTALNAAAATAVAQIGLTAPALVASVGIAKLPPDTTAAGAPETTAALVMLQYTDSEHWFMRSNQASAADNTPDANNNLRFFDVRTRMAPYAYDPANGVAQSFAINTTAERAGDLHWNGNAWVACTLGQRNLVSARDAQGRNTYNSCDGLDKGISVRNVVDISGQSLATVIANKIRSFPGFAVGVPYAQWGAADLTRYGNATFPAGSQLQYNTSTSFESAPAYDVQDSNQVFVFSAAAAAGGDARVGTVACSNAGTSVPTTSLEEMVARFPGSPCVNGPQTNADGTSLNPSEAWGISTVGLATTLANGNVLPAGTGNYYNTNARLRVAFAPTGNATVYYNCLERRADASTRNCSVIGTGTYSIATLGDARVMSFSNLPAVVQGMTSTRVFVERGGKVFFGYKNALGVDNKQVRLNLPAANAVLRTLELPPIQPAEPPRALTGAKAAVAATLKGVWGGADANGAAIFRFGDGGEFLMAQAMAPGGAGRPGYEKGWLDIDPATGQSARLLEIDGNGQWGTSHPQPGEGITGVTDSAISYAGGSIPRFVDDANGIVGMWALGSATDLKATHFIFFANGKALSIHPAEDQGACLTSRQGPPGIEWSDYSFDAATGALRLFNKVYDTSGCTGAFDSADAVPNTEANFVITLAADKKTFTIPVDGGSVILTGYRIATNP